MIRVCKQPKTITIVVNNSQGVVTDLHLFMCVSVYERVTVSDSKHTQKTHI